MKMPEWIKPALVGAGAGAAVLALLGFSWGGWMTSGAADELAAQRTTEAIASVLTPYCVAESKSDPKSAEVLAAMDEASSYQRRGILENAGWATPMGAEEPNHALARECLAALEAKS